MQHFFVTPSQVEDDKIYIEGSDVNHIKNVLRMRIGEELAISDGNNVKYICHVAEFAEDSVFCQIDETLPLDTELPAKIYLFQGLPKQDKMELISQKCVELGVHEIIPVIMKRSIVKLDEKKAKKKVERWNGIALAAAKQAGRGIIPKVSPVTSYKDALIRAKDMDLVLVPYELAGGMETTKEIFASVKPGQSIGIFIGPEGGFDTEEVEMAKAIGGKIITLGRRILRTETAGFTVLAALMFQLEK